MEKEKSNIVDNEVDNYLAAIFTMMLPGLGQLLKRRIISGVIWALAVGGGYLLYGAFGLVIHVLCILDAAFYGNISALLKKQNMLKKSIMLVGLILLITYTVLRTALF